MLLGCSAVSAQQSVYGFSLSAEGFWTVEDLNTVFELGRGGRIAAIYGSDPTLAVELSFAYNWWTDGDNTTDVESSSGAEISYRMMDVTVALRYMFLGPKRGVEPYASAGMGYHRLFRDVSGPSPLPYTRISKFGLVGALGFTYPLSDKWALDAAAVAHYAPNFAHVYTDAGDVVEYSGIFAGLRLGVTCRFASGG
jgi:hypothetical protein